MIVSTLIPAYNSESTIERAIQSVLSQKVPQSELIVVDDGSSDRTSAKVRRYGKKVRYIRQKNQGVSAARNLGLRLARGRFIAFLDADDQWLPGKLRHQMEAFERYPSAMVVSTGVNYLEEDGRLARVYSRELRGKVFDDFLEGNFIVTSSAVLRRDCLRGVPRPFFPPGVFYGEDYAFWLKLAARHEFYASPKVLVNYTQPSDRSFLKKFSERGMTESYRAVIRVAQAYCGPDGIRKLRSRQRLEIASIHARKGKWGKTLWESLAAFWMKPWSWTNILWHFQNAKLLLRNFRMTKG